MNAPAPANSAAVRAIIARVAGASTTVLRRVPPAQTLAEGRIHAPPLAYCESFQASRHPMAASTFPPECRGCGFSDRSSCARDRAGSTS